METNDRYVTKDEISRFEMRVMSVGHGVLGAAREWRAYRREDGIPSETYATLCANLDRAVDEYQEIIRAY